MKLGHRVTPAHRFRRGERTVAAQVSRELPIKADGGAQPASIEHWFDETTPPGRENAHRLLYLTRMLSINNRRYFGGRRL
jgi:hypothetical protein